MRVEQRLFGQAPRDFTLSNARNACQRWALRIDGRSPDSEFGHFRSEIADSLRRIFEIFPFLGDRSWRPGSIYYCVAGEVRACFKAFKLWQPSIRQVRCPKEQVIGSTSIPTPWPMTHHNRSRSEIGVCPWQDPAVGQVFRLFR